jgi:hypothetical protein
MSDACANEAVLDETTKIMRSRLSFGTTVARWWGEVAVVAIALLLWIPRLSGPIDLRWDGGVYYLLGTSLAQGHGYRIPSEPGSPEALQYPPLLPAVVALYERALGSTDPAVVAPWLRKSYAGMFVGYAVAVLALARRYLPPGLAVAAATLSLLHHNTIFLSDLLFTELPFAVISLVFVLVATGRAQSSRAWLHEAVLFLLAAAGFLLRTAGVVLLAAWVIEALMRRRWALVLTRITLALVPIIAWQAHIARVRGSSEYIHAAYEYQRAPYQFYNVSYSENLSLIDPFRPEFGRVNAGRLVTHLANNLLVLPRALGEAVSAKADEWPLKRLDNRLFRQRAIVNVEDKSNTSGRIDPISPEPPRRGIVLVPIFTLSAFVIGGIAILALRRAWLAVLIILGSIALICTTPWPLQFTRYLVALIPFLAICFISAWSQVCDALRANESRRTATVARAALAGLLVLGFAVQSYTAVKLFRLRASKGAIFVAQGIGTGSRFFAHDDSWQTWEDAVTWVGTNTAPDAIVATSAPHLCYLLTNRRSVLPPMESDATRERHLLEGVPVSHAIVDKLLALDVTRRYLFPALEANPGAWHVVYANDGASVYERRAAVR